MENTKLKLYYRGKRGIKETDIEISNVIRDAKFHYIVTSSSLGMCRSIEDAIQKAAKDLRVISENAPGFNRGMIALFIFLVFNVFNYCVNRYMTN